MSALSDVSIFTLISNKELVVEPLDKSNIQPGSIDLTLDKLAFVPNFKQGEIVDIAERTDWEKCWQKIDLSAGYILNPGKFIVGQSAEEIKLSQSYNGAIFNRNSLIYAGIDASLTQYINPGFSGHKIIALKNIGTNPIKICSGLRICQLVIFELDTEAEKTYELRHSGQHIDTSIADFMNRCIDEALKKSEA
ncbi:dCTP deaminase [Mesosutterella sp. OilRF-GAM-744-9]|uniref:dCTP deaminase n=1 Tax=Mesosutterella porci TaxID=2915351 RepID=A0ABS9MUQ7_9BURK|nr:dCTP deaminase [Mesosutterella sp. oilRF-744-WT-GAM-9]MCG5031980.1 dCTP deaminase [Mesosutterella sp. oilRF-744-WT-GAM-9]